MEQDSAQDIIQRLRMMLMGQTPMPVTQGGTGFNNEVTDTAYSTGLLNMPVESEGPQRSMNVLNSQYGYKNPSTNANLGLGFNVMDQSGLGGPIAYGPQVSAGYGPVNLTGGYRTMAPATGGGKSQSSYQYGGSLAIPLEEGPPGSKPAVNLGFQADTGRMGTMFNAGLQAPLLGGLLGVDVTTDPSLRNKQLIAAFRRQF